MLALRSSLAAVSVAAGILASSFAPAQAGDPKFGLYFDGHGGGGAFFGIDGVNVGVGFGGGVGISIEDNKCSKAEALDRAADFGMYNRSIKKITANHITVRGKLDGDKVELVVKRKTSDCEVKDFYYV